MTLQPSTLLSTTNNSITIPNLNDFKYVNNIANATDLNLLWTSYNEHATYMDGRVAFNRSEITKIWEYLENDKKDKQNITNWLYHIDYTPGSSSPPPSYSNKEPNTPGHLQNLHASILNLNDITANMSTNYGDRIYNLEQSNVNQRPKIVEELFSYPGKYGGTINLTKSIEEFDATMIIYTWYYDNTYFNADIRPMWVWKWLHDAITGNEVLKDKAATILTGTGDGHWSIPASDIFTTTWHTVNMYRICIYQIYGLKW